MRLLKFIYLLPIIIVTLSMFGCENIRTIEEVKKMV